MSAKVLRLPSRPGSEGSDTALRSLAAALMPYLQDLVSDARRNDELVDLVETIPAPRRTVMRAARQGEIAGASRVGRRWLAPRAAVEAWLRERGPTGRAPAETDVDDLEDLRRRLARGGRL